MKKLTFEELIHKQIGYMFVYNDCISRIMDIYSSFNSILVSQVYGNRWPFLLSKYSRYIDTLRELSEEEKIQHL